MNPEIYLNNMRRTLSLIVLTLLGHIIAPFVYAKAPTNEEIKVISYNVRLISSKDGPNEWKYRAKASPAMIKDLCKENRLTSYLQRLGLKCFCDRLYILFRLLGLRRI